MRVAVIGSRNYPDANRRVYKRLRSLKEDFPHEEIHVVTDDSKGVNSAAVKAAILLGMAFTVVPELAHAEADRVIAFWDFQSRRTRENIRLAIAAGIHTEVWDKDNKPAGWQAAAATRKAVHA